MLCRRRHLWHGFYRADFGPATNQMMNPKSGSSKTSNTHNTFLPVLTEDPIIEMMAQIARPRRMRPPRPLISNICFSLSCVQLTRSSVSMPKTGNWFPRLVFPGPHVAPGRKAFFMGSSEPTRHATVEMSRQIGTGNRTGATQTGPKWIKRAVNAECQTSWIH